MTSSESIPFYVEMNRIIELLARQIYQTPLALLRENAQNAYDAILMRKYLGQAFNPLIAVTIESDRVVVSDNGIGMTKQELSNHYWRAGSSGKNTQEARAAGVVGTFGIGAMANFGVASELFVVTEPALGGERCTSRAVRETLSATQNCIEITTEAATGSPGTTVTAIISREHRLDVPGAVSYITQFVRFLDFPVTVNGVVVSQRDILTAVPKPAVALERTDPNAALGSQVKADVNFVFTGSGEVWTSLANIQYAGAPLKGILVLRQGMHQVQTLRSKFALAQVAVSSHYGFGGIADLTGLEPTAGREALTTPSVQLLQTIVTEVEQYISERIGLTPFSDGNTGFMEWASGHGRFDLCGNLSVRMEPDNRTIRLCEVREVGKDTPVNYFEGSDPAIIKQYATEDQRLIVISTRQPRRRCELSYLSSFCRATRIVDAPSVTGRKKRADWSLAESAFAFRLVSILDTDYFVGAEVDFGKISHQLICHVDTSRTPIAIVLDSESSSVATMLKLYDSDFLAMTGMVRDFARNFVFPKIANLVPSSTRAGAEAFLKAIRRPREVFEYEKADLGSLSEIWQEYLEGKISLAAAAEQSTNIVRTNVQVVERSATSSVASVIPDVLDNERLLAPPNGEDPDLGPLPAITRLDVESSAKLLTIEDTEHPLKGFRCFLALAEGVRNNRGDFFLQPHRTEIIWGGQKALYIFQHHSGEFGLYYELQSSGVLSDAPGGRAFATCTIVVKNQVYIPVPEEIRAYFIPRERERKRFEVRCELLYPDSPTTDSKRE